MTAGHEEFIQQHVVSSSNQIFVVFRPDGSVARFNAGFRDLLARAGAERSPQELFALPRYSEIRRIANEAGGSIERIKATLNTSDQDLIPFDLNARISDGQLLLIGEIDRDELLDINTQYRQMNAEIQDLNERLVAKDVLIRETNHRVKNNLLILSALIRQKSAATSTEYGLQDLAHQVDAIRVLHDHLSQTDLPGRIDAGSYLCEIAQNAFESLRSDAILECNVSLQSIGPRVAVPLGLLINELATNAAKHGFADSEAPLFSVSLGRSNDGVANVLVVSNSGAHFPDDVDPRNPSSVGLSLVHALARQLDAEMNLKRDPQTQFTFRFPAGNSG